MNQRIVSIAPRLPPSVCGVGDASWLLANAWPDSSDRFSYIVVDGASQSRCVLGCQDIYQTEHSATRLYRLLADLDPTCVILHYSGRGYQRYGTPFWILRGLRRWKTEFPSAKFIIYFHELPDRLSLRSHHGIISRCDRYIAKSLALFADVIATNSYDQVKRLESLTESSPVSYIPVFSNLEDLSCPPSASLRKPREFLIFGQPGSQMQIISHFKDYILEWSQNGLLEVLHLVGPSNHRVFLAIQSLFKGVTSSPIVLRHGVLPISEISSLLCSVGYCLSAVTVSNYSKSGSFMAFASHACPVVCKSKSNIAPVSFTFDPVEIACTDYLAITSRAEALFYWQQVHATKQVVARDWHRLLQS